MGKFNNIISSVTSDIKIKTSPRSALPLCFAKNPSCRRGTSLTLWQGNDGTDYADYPVGGGQVRLCGRGNSIPLLQEGLGEVIKEEHGIRSV